MNKKTMNKKAISMVMSTIVIVAILLLSLTILAYSTSQLTNSVKCSGNGESVKTWVLSKGQKQETTLGLSSQNRPPISPLCDAIQVKSLNAGKEQENAKRAIANGLVDCWSAFANGEIDFLGKRGDDIFCYPCQAIEFSPSVQSSGIKIKDFQKFLIEEKINPLTSETYAQRLSNINPNLFREIPADDALPTNQNLYIFFITAKDGVMHAFGSKLLQFAESKNPWTFLLVGLKIPVYIGAGEVRLFESLVIGKDFNPFLVVGSPEIINSLCSGQMTSKGVTQ